MGSVNCELGKDGGMEDNILFIQVVDLQLLGFDPARGWTSKEMLDVTKQPVRLGCDRCVPAVGTYFHAEPGRRRPPTSQTLQLCWVAWMSECAKIPIGKRTVRKSDKCKAKTIGVPIQ